MERYKGSYREETTEVDAAIESISEFKAFFKKLEDEDLPKYEKRFKEELNQGTINDIAMFKNQLEYSAKDIEEKIRQINRSLREIMYNPGTYIELIADKAIDITIKDFQVQLRNCLENTLADEELYNEEKFNKVKVILDRFNSGALAEVNWTNRVTDVRNWYTFSANERYLEDDTIKEFYPDSWVSQVDRKRNLLTRFLLLPWPINLVLNGNRQNHDPLGLLLSTRPLEEARMTAPDMRSICFEGWIYSY